MENWRIFRRLIGHDNDVQDLGWSCDSSILVSVGLDSKVVVWSGHTFEKLKTLVNHQSHVKGLTFDPANKYFATASDDRTMKVFRFSSPAPNSSAHDQLNNFVLETSITAPFVNSPLTTYFRRCSWSPDGLHIAAANSVNGPVSSVAIINRGSWDSDIQLIGHEAPVEVCAFSPRLYSTTPPEKNPRDANGQVAPGSSATVIACAGGDKSLSLWVTTNSRPLFITQNLAKKAVSDLTWSPDGKTLFATALDGTILVIEFAPGELGYPTDLEENEKSLSKFGGNRRGAGIPETPDGLALEDMSKAGEVKGVEGRMGALMGDGHIVPMNGISAKETTNGTGSTAAATPSTAAVNGTTNGTTEAPAPAPPPPKPEPLKQRVTITQDGKKRVRPILVSSAGGGEASLPQPKLLAATISAQAQDATTSVMDVSKPFDQLPKGGIAALILGSKRKLAQIEGDENNSVQKQLDATAQTGATPLLENTADGLVPLQPRPATSGQVPTPEFIRPALENPSMAYSAVRLAVPKIRTVVVRAIDAKGNATDPPSAGDNNSSKKAADFIFEARNPSGASLTGRAADREPVRISVSKGDSPVWQDFLPRAVLSVAGTQHFWAAACEDHVLYLWTPAGRRIAGALVLDSQPVLLAVKGWWLLCITAMGMCHVYNIKTMTAPHAQVSLAPILDVASTYMTSHTTPGPSLTQARINSEGRIIVALSNGDGYAYSPTLLCWQRLSESWWAVASQYWNTTDSSVGDVQSTSKKQKKSKKESDEVANVSAGIIPFLERNTTTEILLRGRGYYLQRLIKVLLSREGYETFESSASIAHLENRVAGALMLGAKDEFRINLMMYVKRLGAEGLKGKSEELLKTLLGGIFNEDDDDEEDEDEDENADNLNNKKRKALTKGIGRGPGGMMGGQSWEDGSETLCGWDRRELLKQAILLLGMSFCATTPSVNASFLLILNVT